MSTRGLILTLKCDGKELSSVEAERGCDPIEIGRSHTCQMRTPMEDNSVSGHHAKLYWKGASLYLEDMGSRNGIYFNGKRLAKPVKVVPDGLYAIGNCVLSASAPSKASRKNAARCHQLEFINGDRAREIVDIRAKPDSRDGGFYIGLDPSCDICLADMLVSRRHAKLTVRQNGDCWIADEGSRNGTFVNGEKLSGKERLLKDGDKISIAYFDLRFLDRNTSHTRAYLWAKLGALLITGVVLTVLYIGYEFGPQRATAADCRALAEKSAGNGAFDRALKYVEDARNARNGSAEKLQNDALRGQIKLWKQTSEKWEEIKTSLGKGLIVQALKGLDGLMSEAYAWTWNETTAVAARKEAEFAARLLRAIIDAAEDKKRAESSKVGANAKLIVTRRIAAIDNYLGEASEQIDKTAYLKAAVENLNEQRAKLDLIRSGIARIDSALEGVSAAEPDFSAAAAEFSRVVADDSLPAGVRAYARGLLPVCEQFIETQKFLERERTRVCDLEFHAVLADKDKMPLPDKGLCANTHTKFSDARAAFQRRHAAYQQEVEILGPMVRNLESVGIRRGEKGHLVTFVVNPATWDRALSFDCFTGRFPRSSRVDPTGVYDELLGIEATYENLRELPKPPGRKTTVLMNFVPKCQTAKIVFDQVRTFLRFMDRPDSAEFRSSNLGRLYALGTQILAERDALIKTLKQKAANTGASDRARIIAGYYGVYLSDEPDYADLRALEMAFRKLQKEMNALNERYDSEPDPEKRLALRGEILAKGIPGMEAVRTRWVEAEE